MDDIEDCFTKFFCKQAVEVEPETIQSLINYGYKTKISLIAMDLSLDLPQMGDIALAQRSILRKYIGALQEYSPFILTIDENALNKYKEPSKPNKKRKLESVERDSDTESDYPHEWAQSGSSFATSPKRKASRGITTSNGVVLPKMSPVRAHRLSIKFNQSQEKNEPANEDVVMQDDSDEETEPEAKPAPKRAARGGRVPKVKAEVTRTQSQLRHQQMRETLARKASKSHANNEINNDETDEEVPEVKPQVTVSNSRRANARTSAAIEEPKTVSIGRKSMTPAEMAIRAKIEAKKAAEADKKAKRGRKSTK